MDYVFQRSELEDCPVKRTAMIFVPPKAAIEGNASIILGKKTQKTEAVRRDRECF